MNEALEQFEAQENNEERPAEFTQKEIAAMKEIKREDIKDVRKGDFAKINGQFKEVERIEWIGTEGFVVTTDDERYKISLVRVFKKNPSRP